MKLSAICLMAVIIGILPLRAHEGPHKSAPGVILSKEQALARAFPGATVERRTAFLTEDQANAVARTAATTQTERMVAYYVAEASGSIRYAFFDRHRVEKDYETVMVVVSEGRVRSVMILSFGEAGDYLPTDDFLKTFSGKRLEEIRLPPTGMGPVAATLARQAIATSARRALANLSIIKS